MTNNFRALCAELTATLAERIDDKGDAGSYYIHAAHLLTRARAALAGEPPEPIPPAALPEGYIDPEHSGDDRALLQTFYSACQAEGGTTDEVTLQGLRAVLARWGTSNLTQTRLLPADGEVAELVAEIRHFLAGYQQMRGLDPEHIYSIHRGDKMEAHITVSRLTRAAELLQRQALVPVPVSERPPGPKDCDAEGRCWWGTPSFVNCYSVTQSAQWRLSAPDDRFGSEVFWLPAHALPLPEVGE